ncbi:MAG: calcium-binding EGF-like domain-containing protein [Bacteroidetes bacterium]|nr:calcium-binding EGF-like domain-containing protein [Bacteroidota bacterium]
MNNKINFKKAFFTGLIIAITFSSVLFNSCNKEDNCSRITCQNGGACLNGACKCPSGFSGTFCEINNGSNNGNNGQQQTNSIVLYKNASFTDIAITVNGNNKTIPFGSSASFTDIANTKIVGTATTSGKTSNNIQVGLKVSWDLSGFFPASGTSTVNINVDNTMFFLKIANVSAKQITKIYVNYGLANQSFDNVIIPNNGTVYNIGYYKAFSNSNIRLESADGTIWNYGVTLPFTNNQSFTFTAK